MIDNGYLAISWIMAMPNGMGWGFVFAGGGIFAAASFFDILRLCGFAQKIDEDFYTN